MSLATYREAWFDCKRLIELNDDSIRVSGSATFQSEFDTSIPLVRIYPAVNRFRVRSRAFWAGMWLVIAGVVVPTVLVSGLKCNPLGVAPGLFYVFGISGVVFCLATLRKVEWARFQSDAGLAVLDIVRRRSRPQELRRVCEPGARTGLHCEKQAERCGRLTPRLAQNQPPQISPTTRQCGR